jgi:tRNA modification GTPase
LLQEERAIVSETPGTTRDTIEEIIHLGGFSFRFIDTAGLRKEGVEDEVEARGIERTLSKLSQAAIVLAVTEATDTPDEIIAFYNSVKNFQTTPGSKIIAVINKTDLLTTGETGSLREILSESGGFVPIFVSARESSGIEDVRQHLIKSVETEGLKSPQLIVTNSRHWHSLINVSASLERALEGFRNGIPTVLIATDVRQAIHYLGEITGKITGDEILGDIFKNFCIGK